MIVAKFLLLFSPLLLLANAQSGGRLGFFARPDFRRPRPWQRPTIAPVPDTPMPTEKVTEHITNSPRASTELSTNTPVRATPGVSVSSASISSQHGRVWARPVFQGSRAGAISTPEAITPTESITKAADYPPAVSIVSSTTKPEVYIITPSITVPFVDNHALYKDPNSFNSRGRYEPKLTHNNDEIPSDSTKPTTKLPLTTENITEIITEQTTIPAENHSPMVSSTSTTTESVQYTIASTTAAPFINNPTTELRTTLGPLTTPRVTFMSTRATNFNSRSPLPPYMSQNNLPTLGILPQYIPGDYLKPSSTTNAAATVLPSSTTESAGYTMGSSTQIPFVDEHKGYDDIYITAQTSIPLKIISTTEETSASTIRPNYQVTQNDKNKIANDSEQHLTTISKAVTIPTTKPEDYIITATTKAPFVDEHKEYDNGFTSHLSVEYANGYEKSSEEQSKSDGYNAPMYPVYHHETEKVSHYEQSSLSTKKPEGYTATTKIPNIDLHKLNDVGSTSGPVLEYTNWHETPTSKIPTDDFQEFIPNIYPNHNDFEHSSTPKMVTQPASAQSQSAYQYRPPKTTSEQAVVTQTVRQTNSYRYSDMTTKPTTRYTTTTTVRPARLKNVYDIENFKCKDQDGYYSISNQCDDFVECKSGYPVQNSCPDGLHFNPAAKYGEFPCAYPSEVKCDSNSVIRQPEPTSGCPRRYGYFSMQDGRCDKYIMCQEGLATIMSCPAGLAFSVATSSCDWPSNVPDCLPDAFQGFTCPAPEVSEDGEPTPSILKYRYAKSCKKYIACQRGHPRLLSCDSGLAFDENSESCVDEFDVTDCT